MPSKLELIARDMRAEVIRTDRQVRRELARGLVLILSADLGRWVLVLSRPVTTPSDKEIAIVRAAFGVPADDWAYQGENEIGEVVIRWPQ